MEIILIKLKFLGRNFDWNFKAEDVFAVLINECPVNPDFDLGINFQNFEFIFVDVLLTSC